jgi:predicted aconitase with swiveling domain
MTTELVLKGRIIVGGQAEGTALVTREAISFFGGVDPRTGMIIERGHELEACKISGKVLVFPRGKGSTVGSYIIYAMSKYGTAPAAMVNLETEPIIAIGAVLANIPLMDKFNKPILELIKTGDYVTVLSSLGILKVRSAENR